MKRKYKENTKRDGSNYYVWGKNTKGKSFSVHPNGFFVFLSPENIKACDEYSESDPYTVVENLNNEFHRRRIGSTLRLVKLATKNNGNLKILDLGCGQGHITSIIKKNLPSTEVSGMDYSVSAIEYASSNFKDVDFSVGDAYNTPYTDDYFDIIICNNLWEHVQDPLSLLREIRRILKFEGYLIISTPSRYHLDNLLGVLRGKSVSFMSNLHVTEYTVGQVIEQLKFGSFEVIKVHSKPIPNRSLKKSRVIIRIMLGFFLKLIKSHHILESTVFYLARNKKV